MTAISSPPQPGQVVRVRQRQYLVEEAVPPVAPTDSTLVRLSCLDDDAQGQPLEVLWEREVDPEVITGESWDRLAARGFDPPKLFAAYLHTLRWNCVTATDPRLFQAPFRAGIRIEPYQLEPLRKALLLPRVNLFIADDVGLGKTIEAGLIARELLLRKKVRDIIVACPPSMLLQWKEELETRFGLTFVILDRDYIAAGAPPLAAIAGSSDPEQSLERYAFPALDQREGADPTWADTMDTLRTPRKKDQKPWEWRRDSPVRPVVFEDTGTMDEDVVHLHLEHRVVQRLLGRFTAQGFVHHDLSRACLAQSNDPIPRVILIGRLCLYGPGAARLHEELVPVTARWLAPSQRRGPLTPYGREAETKTLDLLDDALLAKARRPVTDTVLRQLQAAAPEDVRELLRHLETRGRELGREAENQLAERGRREAESMRGILESQQKRVEETAAKYRDPQLSLDFDQEEKRQLDANRRHWEKRLLAIDRELESEPTRIREIYRVKARRIEPVGLVYLWPVTG